MDMDMDMDTDMARTWTWTGAPHTRPQRVKSSGHHNGTQRHRLALDFPCGSGVAAICVCAVIGLALSMCSEAVVAFGGDGVWLVAFT